MKLPVLALMFGLFLSASSYLSASTLLSLRELRTEYLRMTPAQHILLQNAHNRGKPFDLGYTLAAIAWRESQAGLININIFDPSCGPFHNNLNSVFARHNYEDTRYKKNAVCQKLITNFDFAAAEGLAELEYWVSVHDGNLRKTWASYNAGWNYDSRIGKMYAEMIARRITILKEFIKE